MNTRLKDVLIVVAAVVIIGCVVMLASKAAAQEPARIEVKELGIDITAVEFTVTKVIQCEVYYWHPRDPNQDGVMEDCVNLEYDPCEYVSGQRVFIQHNALGGSCDPAPPPLSCNFSPKPQGCP
jgi:hypothetical protein